MANSSPYYTPVRCWLALQPGRGRNYYMTPPSAHLQSTDSTRCPGWQQNCSPHGIENAVRTAAWLALLLAAPMLWGTTSGGPLGRTGFAGEPTCQGSGCHTPTPYPPGSGRVTIDVSPYVPGQKQRVTVTITDISARRWGFQLAARERANPLRPAGSLASFQDNSLVWVRCASGTLPPCNNELEYATHTSTGSQTIPGLGSAQFHLEWTAPAALLGDVILTAAALAADGNLGANGDQTYTGTAISPQVGAPCAFTLTPISQAFAASAGTGAITVATGTNCGWTAVSGAPWITIASGAAGAGIGTVNYTLAANTDSASRAGTISIAAQVFTITQAGLILPLVGPDGVVNAASFQAGIASGAWVTVSGANLASAPRAWRDSDFIGNRLPTELDGVSVAINGRPAYVYYISPVQINALAPGDPAEGPVQVQVTNAQGRSAPVTARKQRFAPAFFPFEPEGRKYAAAVHPDGTLVGKANLFGPGVPTRPARPGDVIMLFGTGFGAADPPAPEGELVRQPGRLTTLAAVLIGGVAADIHFAGIVGAGLYQFNVVVPSLPDGDHPVLAEIGGFRSQANAFLTVQAP